MSASRVLRFKHSDKQLTEFNADAAMFILYTVAPLLYRLASSTYYNLSLLSSDFYGLLFGEYWRLLTLADLFDDFRRRPIPIRTFLLLLVNL